MAAVLLGIAAAVLLPLSGPAGGPVTPVLAQQAPPPADYLLNPGDSVEITVLGEADLTRPVTIRPDGKINLPLIGDIVAAGLTPVQLADRITTALKAFLRNPQVSVAVREIRPERNFVYLVGQFSRPGPVEIQKGWTITEVMAVAGGFTPRAALRRASIVRRVGGQTVPLDLEKLVLRGDRSVNPEVEPGDIIMLPTLENRVLVLGYVRAPGVYDMEDDNRVLDAIARAGGTAERANTTNIGVIRDGPGGKPVVTTVNMAKILAGDASQNVKLQNADVVYVPEGAIVRWTDIISYISGFGLLRTIFGR